MGFFSGEDITSTYVSVSRVIDDKSIPDTNTQSILRALLNDTSITESIIDGALHGPALKFEAYYRYGRDHYTFGLPNSRITNNNAGKATVEAIIANLAGAPIETEYFRFGSVDPTHLARQILDSDYGYNYTSNELAVLSAQYGAPVYLKDITNLFPEGLLDTLDPRTFEIQGPPATAGYTPERPAQLGSVLGLYRENTVYAEDPAATHVYARVRLTYLDPTTGAIVQDALDISLADYTLSDDYFQVMYRNTQTGRYHFWSYRYGAGTYPALDRIHDPEYTDPGSHFPIVLLRRGDTNRTASIYHDTQEYRTTTELLDKLGLDFQQLGDTIHENPDIDDVEQAVLMMAVPMNAQDNVGLKFLFEYFNHQYYTNPVAPISKAPASGRIVNSSSAIMIQDADYRMFLQYTGIEKRMIAGRIGAVGTYLGDSGYITYTVTQRVLWRSSKNGDEYRMVTRERRRPYKRYRKQINATFYEELKVYNPYTTWIVYQGKYNFNAGIGEGIDQLMVPIDKSISDSFTSSEREELYLRSLYFVFCSRQTQHLEWYETGAFAAIVTIAAIAISIITMNPMFAAAAIAGIQAVAMLILTLVVKAVVFNYVFSFVVEQLGIDNAFLLAVIAAVAAAYSGAKAGSLQNAPWATELLAVSNGLSQGIQTQMGKLMAEYNSERQAFDLYRDAATQELEEANSLLDVSSLINPFEFIGQEPAIVFGESPDNFYQRTVHSGNIGTIGLDAVGAYVDVALSLPDINNTAGGTFYG